MDDDPFSEIDSILSEELPDAERTEDGVVVGQETRKNIINILRYAAEEVGKSPTVAEFNALDLDVTADHVRAPFGTWNEAKEAAGLETWQRGTSRRIDEDYFETIDSAEKAYWFGAVFATSSLHDQEMGQNYSLVLGRVEDKSYFVTEFADAVDSEHKMAWHDSNKSDKRQIQLAITNPRFVKHLLAAGYDDPEGEPGGFPAIADEYRAPFLRGFLESSGYFSTNGWQVTVANLQRAETLQEWFEQFGAKRPTVSEKSSKGIVVRVSNVFDIKSVFEALWPDLTETDPSWDSYPRKIRQYLQSEYPYPENLPYLD